VGHFPYFCLGFVFLPTLRGVPLSHHCYESRIYRTLRIIVKLVIPTLRNRGEFE